MSCTVSHELNGISRAILCQLLADEKEDTRGLLRAEMDRLVDSMFHRLTNKLMMNSHLGRYQSGDGIECALVELEQSNSQLDKSSFVTAQPSTSSHLIPQHQNVHYSYQQPNDPIHSNDNSNQQSQLMTSLIQPTMSPNANFEIPNSNEPTTTDQVHSLSTSSQSAIANEEKSNHNFDEDDDEGECDCDDCQNAIEIIEEGVEDDDDNDSVQWIEEVENEPRPVKRPRLDLNQPNNATQPEVEGDQATQSNQVANHDKQIITLRLPCPLSNCPDTFPEDQLNQHMMEKHRLGPLRCLVKDCRHAFDNNRLLGDHIKQVHHSTRQWHCDKCDRHFPKYLHLSVHNNRLDQLGHFQCSFPSCTFTGEYKQKVYNHYIQHKAALKCQHPGCHFESSNSTDCKKHQRIHSGAKPYRCTWSVECDYAGTQKAHVIKHIRVKHLAPNPGSVSNGPQLDPKDYVEVMHDLL